MPASSTNTLPRLRERRTAESGIGGAASAVGSWRETKSEGLLKAACHPKRRDTVCIVSQLLSNDCANCALHRLLGLIVWWRLLGSK
jgi:hypothetical protein